jgi:hypothetical protein
MRRWRCLLFLLVPHVWAGVFLFFLTVEMIAWAAAGRDVPAEVLDLTASKTMKGHDVFTLRFAWSDQGIRRVESQDVSRAAFADLRANRRAVVRDWKLGTLEHHEPRTPGESPWGSVWTAAAATVVWDGMLVFAFSRMKKSAAPAPPAGPAIAPRFLR